MVKQEMTRVNVDILGISELIWTGMGEFNSDDHYIYYRGQESLRRNGVAIMVNKRVRNAVLGCNLKNDRMISVCLQGKPFNITVIQALVAYTTKMYVLIVLEVRSLRSRYQGWLLWKPSSWFIGTHSLLFSQSLFFSVCREIDISFRCLLLSFKNTRLSD